MLAIDLKWQKLCTTYITVRCVAQNLCYFIKVFLVLIFTKPGLLTTKINFKKGFYKFRKKKLFLCRSCALDRNRTDPENLTPCDLLQTM